MLNFKEPIELRTEFKRPPAHIPGFATTPCSVLWAATSCHDTAPLSHPLCKQLLCARTSVRSEKEARPRLTLEIRLISTFLIRLSV
jgi:hypothetical protein